MPITTNSASRCGESHALPTPCFRSSEGVGTGVGNPTPQTFDPHRSPGSHSNPNGRHT
jgi:hypothetical protein